MGLACMICIVTKGIRGKDIFETEEELIDHMESVHHMPLVHKGETNEQAARRFLEKYPEAKSCPECIAADAIWTRLDKEEVYYGS